MMLAFYVIQVLVWITADLLVIQLPVRVPVRAADNGLSALASATHVRYPGGVLGSWLWPDSSMATAVIGEVDQQMEMSVLHPSPFSSRLFCLPCK